MGTHCTIFVTSLEIQSYFKIKFVKINFNCYVYTFQGLYRVMVKNVGFVVRVLEL